MIPESNHYWLKNARVPVPLIVKNQQDTAVGSVDVSAFHGLPLENQTSENCLVDLEIRAGVIATIVAAGTSNTEGCAAVDLRGGQVWSCFVDLHTHLDKGQIWNRAPNPDGTFATAIKAVQQDVEKYWDETDVYRRMEFGLKCSYAHGTQAIRTHIDASGEQAAISFGVFKALQAQWADRLTLQAACLVPLDYYLTSAGEKLADYMVEVGGILGGVAYMNPDIAIQADRLVTLAKERNLDLDIHVDENNSPDSITLRHVAESVIHQDFQGRVVCGHCCSLSVQESEAAEKTIALVKQAGIGIVSLPLCNLYLQDRQPRRTPRWRGVTLLHELKQAGVPVAIASDNCRDPFHAYGDHDGLEVFSWSVKIAHLDRPFSDWCRTITQTPADLMGLSDMGRIGVGLPANLILFKARSYSELLSRSQHDRIILRKGKVIDTTLPDYAELDDLEGY